MNGTPGITTETEALRLRLHNLERAAWRLLALLNDGTITAAEVRFIDAATEAFDDLEAALQTNEGRQA